MTLLVRAVWDGFDLPRARRMRSANLVVIEGAGHLPALERPGESAKLVRRFLEAPAASRAELQDLRSP